MKNFKNISDVWVRFRAQDAGAVTIDFVVITAAIIGLTIAVLGAVGAGSVDLASDVGSTLSKFELWGIGGGPPIQ
jgi:hypothetical protein